MTVRDTYLAHFRDTAQDIFAKHPNLRSIVLAVSQYWNDEANDAVHDWIVASERDLPLWPHLCAGDYGYDEDNQVEPVAGECCAHCAPLVDGWLRWWDNNSSAIGAFAAMCHESGTQDQGEAYNALPAAIARKRCDAIEVELLGPVLRPHEILAGALPNTPPTADPTWSDPRALELYAQVCTSPADDGPRRVLADYLLERDVPRGELLAHALADSPAYTDLLAQHRRAWLYPLDSIVPLDTARFDRGFVAAAELFAVDRAYRGHPVLNSLERLHVHAGSASVLHPDMRALHELGPINRAWLEDLVVTPRPWAIETLDVDVADDGMIAMMRATTTLPALRHLILRGDFAEQAAGSLAPAAWWNQLERLTIVDPLGAPDAWHARRTELGVPWLAVRMIHDDPVRAEGWELAFGPNNACEATLRGFTPEATRLALKQLLASTPVRAVTLVASPHYKPAAVDAEFLSRDGQLVT